MTDEASKALEFCPELISMIEAAKVAGETVSAAWKLTRKRKFSALENLPSVMDDAKMKSNSTDLQTETDRKSEQTIVEILKKKFPTYKFIGEETTDSDGGFELSADPTFVIDPIDGTTNFVHAALSCSVLVAFAKEKQLTAGVILDPIVGEVFFAEKGKGAWYLGRLSEDLDSKKRLRTSGCKDLTQAVLCTDVGYQREEEGVSRFLDFQRKVLLGAKIRGIRVIGGCGLGLAYVAAGRFDAYIENTSPYIWDFSAGCLIVEEAGGAYCDPSGKPLDLTKRSVAASATKELSEAFVKLLK